MIVFIHKCMKHLLNRHYCFRFWKVNKSISWSLKFYNNFYLKIKYFKFRLWQFCKILYLKTRLFLHDEKEYFCFCISKFFLEVWLPCNNLKNKTTNTIISIDQFLKFWFTFFCLFHNWENSHPESESWFYDLHVNHYIFSLHLFPIVSIYVIW